MLSLGSHKEQLCSGEEIAEAMKKRPYTEGTFDSENVHVETKNTQMIAFINRIRDGALNLRPEFQRSPNIWKPERQSKLIESMILQIPLPAFYVDAVDGKDWKIIDGLQRLNTIDRFVIKQDLRLTGLELMRDLNGQTFDSLPSELRRRIEENGCSLQNFQR